MAYSKEKMRELARIQLSRLTRKSLGQLQIDAIMTIALDTYARETLAFEQESTFNTAEDTSTYQTRVENKSKKGPIIASWEFKGTQIRGESRRKLSKTIEAAKDRASDAVSENRIPRKYESAVKTYFGRLEEHAKE